MTDVERRSDSRAAIPAARVALAVPIALLLFAALLFVPAGGLRWAHGWIYLGIVVVNMAINLACLRRWNPELIERRMHFGEGTKRWDTVWATLNTPVMIAVYVVAGLEARMAPPELPGPAWLLGLAIFMPGSALLTWSMVANPFFERTVRIQTDRGHRVVDSGPYAYVRHPGYMGFVGWMLSTPLLLASVWALVPALLAVLGIVIRTVLEDRTLQAELPGYREYAARVRFRLIPGVW